MKRQSSIRRLSRGERHDVGQFDCGIDFWEHRLRGVGYGKKQARFKTMTIGIILIGYPYVVSNVIAIYVIGAALMAALFFFKD